MKQEDITDSSKLGFSRSVLPDGLDGLICSKQLNAGEGREGGR